MKKWLTVLCFLLLLLSVSAALGETSVAYTPEQPRVGDYVDVVVTPDRENPKEVIYELLCNGEKSIAYKPENKKAGVHLAASFRPRTEGTYTLRVTVTYSAKDKETAEVTIPVSGTAPVPEGPDVVYSQKDGWWYRVKYSSTRDLQKAGCAIFSMSHILQRLGFSGEAVTPQVLGKTYSYFYKEGEGTWNEGLVNKCAQAYDFLTQKDVMRNTREIAAALGEGDLFTFSIVDGHIAMGDALSEDGTKIHVVDSAPGATFDRIRFKGNIFYRNEDGTFTQTDNPADLPGIRWFFETQEYGGAEYWMNLDYLANRGVRLVRPYWLKADLGEGLRGVGVEYAGAVYTKVTRGDEAVRVRTKDLVLSGEGAPKVAYVTAAKGTFLVDANGKKIADRKKIPRNTLLLLFSTEDGLLYAWWDDSFGYLNPKDVDVMDPAAEDVRTGLIAMNGKAVGNTAVIVHLNPQAKSMKIAQWKVGTPAAVIEKKDEFYLLEAKGMRGWVHEKYFIPDQPEPAEGNTTEGSQEDGQKIDEGK